jgi:uncharacterized protein (DUF433 family)
VHYWLDTELLSSPLVHGKRGTPTLLNFRQLLEIRTVLYLRDHLDFSLVRVRKAFQFILEALFQETWVNLTFTKGVNGELIVQIADGTAMSVPGGQGVMPEILPELNAHTEATRAAWETRVLPISEHLVSNARIQAGSPTVKGTRIETANIAAFSPIQGYPAEVIDLVSATYPQLPRAAITEAMAFEGLVAVA